MSDNLTQDAWTETDVAVQAVGSGDAVESTVEAQDGPPRPASTDTTPAPDVDAATATATEDAVPLEADEAEQVDEAATAEDSTPDEDEDEDEAEAEADAPARGRGRREQLEREGEVAADFLETLLDICDLDGDIDVDIDGDRAAVSVVDSEDGRVPRRLVGENGKVLDALQELTRLAVQSATGERSRLMLDVGGHRAARRAALVTVAAQAVEEVRSTGERKPLAPMTAFERKVVHDEVLAAGLVSESEGTEPRRYVVVLPA